MSVAEPIENAIEIRVDGHAQPGGSKTAIPIKRGDRYLHDSKGRPLVQVVDANPKAKTWRRTVAKRAADQFSGELLTGPMLVEIEIYLHRWKKHFGTGRNARLLKDDAPLYPAGDHSDADKLARPILDGLSGVVYDDDARVVDLIAKRRYVPGYCVQGMPGEYVVVRIMQHNFCTVGERAAAAQQTLLPA